MKEYKVEFMELSTGQTIAYRRAGSRGPEIFLVHGNMTSSAHWDKVMEALEEDYRVHAVDLRGFGDSSYHTPVDSLRDFSLDVSELIEKLDLKEVILVGWSTGGGVVLETAADIPERIAKVVLLDSVGLQGYPMFKKDEEYKMMLDHPLLTKEEIALDPVQVLPVLNAYEKRDKEFLKIVWNATIYDRRKPEKEDYDRYLEANLKQRNLVDVDYSLVHFNFTHEDTLQEKGSGRIDALRCPVYILHGKEDLVVPYEQALQTKEFFGDRATLIPFENVGHSVLTDDLMLFVNTLKDIAWGKI